MYSPNNEAHSEESRSKTRTPSERSHSMPPWKLRLSPTTSEPKPSCRTSPLQYQHGASVVTIGQTSIAALASRVAEGIGFAMHGRVIVLYPAVTTRADELACGIKDRSSDRDASFGQPLMSFRQRHRQHRRMGRPRHDFDYIEHSLGMVASFGPAMVRMNFHEFAANFLDCRPTGGWEVRPRTASFRACRRLLADDGPTGMPGQKSSSGKFDGLISVESQAVPK